VDLVSPGGVTVASPKRKLLAVDWAQLGGGGNIISWKNNRRVKYPMLVIVMVVMVMVVLVIV
jgi:hypothetical protein